MSPAMNMNVMNVCLLWRPACSDVVDVVDADDSAGGSSPGPSKLAVSLSGLGRDGPAGAASVLRIAPPIPHFSPRRSGWMPLGTNEGAEGG